MNISILRHGKAEDTGSGMRDGDRKLTEKGRDEITLARLWMASQGSQFDLIAASLIARDKIAAAIAADDSGSLQ